VIKDVQPKKRRVDMCNKIQFSSTEDARDYIKAVAPRAKGGRKKKSIKKSTPYKCPECSYFHITSETAVERRARRKDDRQRVLVRSKVDEYLSIKGISERWRWLTKNQEDFITVITGNRSFVKFDGFKARHYID